MDRTIAEVFSLCSLVNPFSVSELAASTLVKARRMASSYEISVMYERNNNEGEAHEFKARINDY
jgi:hypothetical protein